MSNESVEEVPWTTATEHLETILDDLGIPDDHPIVEEAHRLVDEHGRETTLNPRTTAVGAIYLAGILAHGRKYVHVDGEVVHLYQPDLADVAECSATTVSNGYRELARLDGIPIATGSMSTEDEEAGDILAESPNAVESVLKKIWRTVRKR